MRASLRRAVQLVHEVPASRQHISDALPERSDIVGPSLGDQWQHLVLCPLSVIALDKCDNEYDIRIIVQLLAEARSSLIGARLRVFLTSRPEVPVWHGFRQVPETEHRDAVLHNISPLIVDHDIGLFLEETL